MSFAVLVLVVASCAIGGDRGDPPSVVHGADISAGVSSVSPAEYCYTELDGLSGSENRACASTEQLYLPEGRSLDEVVAGDCLLLADDGEGNIVGHWWGVSEDECEWAVATTPTTEVPT
jgi:hypothetical protein